MFSRIETESFRAFWNWPKRTAIRFFTRPEGMNFEYSIIYSNRKTLQIIVERDRSVVVRAPINTSTEKISEAVEKKKLWLYEKINHPQKYDVGKEKPLIPGSSILYLG